MQATTRSLTAFLSHHQSIKQLPIYRHLSRPTTSPRSRTNHERPPNHRTFVTNPFSTPQTLTGTRIIQQPPSIIYDIISDVASYSTFIPYCHTSRVTKTSGPAGPRGKRYPEEAELVVGFNASVSEAFWSRIYCVPDEVIETLGGPRADTLLPAHRIAHHSPRPPPAQDPTRSDSVLSHLRTRWTLRPYPYKSQSGMASGTTGSEGTRRDHEETREQAGQTKTEVHLAIEFQFANPVYAALSQAAAPKVAEQMIEAFERRVQSVTEGTARATAR